MKECHCIFLHKSTPCSLPSGLIKHGLMEMFQATRLHFYWIVLLNHTKPQITIDFPQLTPSFFAVPVRSSKVRATSLGSANNGWLSFEPHNWTVAAESQMAARACLEPNFSSYFSGWWFQLLWKYENQFLLIFIIPNIWENKTCSNPPTSSNYSIL